MTYGGTGGGYPPNWYPDPSGPPGQLRWYDGARWTEHTQSAPAAPATPFVAVADEAPLMETVAGFYRVDPPGFRAFDELRPTDDRPAKALGMTLDRAGTAARNAQRQEFWRSRAALWNELEADRLRASRRWMPFNVPSQGLLTCHGGTLDSWCSLLCVMAAQWVWRQEPSVVIDSSNEVGAELSEFLAGMRPEAPDLRLDDPMCH